MATLFEAHSTHVEARRAFAEDLEGRTSAHWILHAR